MIMEKYIQKHTNKWKYIPCSCIEELILLKYLYYPKVSIDSIQSNIYQNSNDIFFIEGEKNLKICMEPLKMTLAAKAILRKKAGVSQCLTSTYTTKL